MYSRLKSTYSLCATATCTHAAATHIVPTTQKFDKIFGLLHLRADDGLRRWVATLPVTHSGAIRSLREYFIEVIRIDNKKLENSLQGRIT